MKYLAKHNRLEDVDFFKKHDHSNFDFEMN